MVGETNHDLVRAALACAEKILCWNFVANASSIVRSRDENLDKEKNPLKLPVEWRNVLLVPELLSLFFQLCTVYFNEPDMSAKTITCLTQLASVHGPIFDTQEMQQVYVNNFLGGFKGYLSNVLHKITNPQNQVDTADKIYSLAQISNHIFRFSSIHILAKVSEFPEIMKGLGQVAVICLDLKAGNVDDTWFLDAGDDILLMWAAFVEKFDTYSPEEILQLMADPAKNQILFLLSEIAAEIVSKYIEVHVIHTVSDEEDDESYDFMQKDVELYSDQLLHICVLSRLKVDQVLAKLINIINQKTQQLTLLFQSGSGDASGELMAVQEQIHWAVLISGHVLADSAFGETPQIPNSILKASSNSTVENDPAVNLTKCIFNLLNYLSFPVGSPQHDACSPLLLETLFWFTDRWATTYLFADMNEYSIKSKSLHDFCGLNGGAPAILDFILSKIELNAIIWHTELDIVSQIITLLQGLSKNKATRDQMLANAKFTQIVHYFLLNISRLPSTVHSPIVQTIVYTATHATDDAVKHSYFKNLSDAIEGSLNSIIQSPDFGQHFETTVTREKVIVALELFGGLALSVDETTTVQIFETCGKHFSSFVKLLDIYKSHPDVELYIITIFKDLIKNQSFDALQQQHCQLLYHAVLELIQVYTKNESGRHRAHQSLDEEELYEDLSVLLELLAGLIASEYEGFERETVLARMQKNESDIDVSKVVFVGVNNLLALITKEMLEFPRLCLDYMHLVSLLVEYFPDRLSTLPVSLLNSLVQSLIFGTTLSIGRIPGYSLKAIQSLALFAWSENGTGHSDVSYLLPALDTLLSETMEALLIKPLDTTILDDAANTVFALAIVRPATIQALFNNLVERRINHSMGEHINKLMQSISENHQKTYQKLVDGTFQIGWGSAGLERYPSLNGFRKLFITFILESRSSILVI
ncbi:Exportin-4 [Terramyces sp. JEL0728]|nr:Exportin-4 [Terramyces sp. JEL0728]